MNERTASVSKVSVVVPAYNEAENLPKFYDRLERALAGQAVDWEWIVVDDHSSDATFEVLSQLAGRDPRVRVIRLARNHGSFAALACGLHHAKGDCAVILAADLQDPPEVIPELLSRWQQGGQVVWAVRNRRLGERFTTRAFSRMFYWLMRNLAGMKEMPASGADFLLMDRCVVNSFSQFRERSLSIIPLITWMGYRQVSITYDKQARVHGQTGWSLEKKFKYAIDSITAFTYLPIRLISYTGLLVALAGFAFAGYVIVEAFNGQPVLGYPSLMVAILGLGGMQMVMLGVLGEYLWRTFDEVRGRPRFLIERTIDAQQPHQPSPASPEAPTPQELVKV